MKLQVVTQADITSGDGRYILREALSEDYKGANTDYVWPNQGDLPQSYWKLWQRAIKKAFPTTTDRKLYTRLGRWYQNGRNSLQAAHDPTHAVTYVRRHQRWMRYRHRPRQLQADPVYDFAGEVTQLPQTAQPAVAWLTDDSITFHGSAPWKIGPTD